MKPNIFRRYPYSGILLLSIFSIVLNIILYSQFRKYYTLLYAVELDPLGISSYQVDTNQQKPNEQWLTVVFFGDSRASQWANPKLDGFWFVNRGIGNQTSAQITGRFDEHIKPLQPDIIVLQVGINDLKTIPLFPEKKREIIANYETNLQEIVRKSLELNAIVIISTIFPTGKIPFARRLIWSNDIEKSIVEVNNHIYSLQSEKVIIFDAAKLLSDMHGKIKQEYSVDELHLNEAGYQRLNTELVKLLRTIKPNPK